MSLFSRILDAVFGPPTPAQIDAAVIEVAKLAEGTTDNVAMVGASPADLSVRPYVSSPAGYDLHKLEFPAALEVAGKMKDDDWLKVLEYQSEKFEKTYTENTALKTEVAALKTKINHLLLAIKALGGNAE